MLRKIVYVIDGNNVVHRGHRAAERNPMRAADGRVTSGIVHLWNVLKRCSAHSMYTAVAFDRYERELLHRCKLDPDYKGNRKATTPEEKQDREVIHWQMKMSRKLCRAAGIPLLGSKKYEADDFIAAIARSDLEDAEIRVITYDKDLTQLVNKRVRLYDTKLECTYDTRAVQAKFGIKPRQICHYLALTGDDVDNIPNVPGIGPGRASKLLSTYGDLAGIYANLHQIPKAQAAALKENKKRVQLNCKLTKLYPVTQEFKLDDLRWKSPNKDKLDALYRTLGFVHSRWR